MTDRLLLVYAQDVGGAKFLAPTLPPLLRLRRTVVIAHPLAEAALREHRVPFRPLARELGGLPVGEDAWETWLRRRSVTHVYCTLSSPLRDRSNAHLVRACVRAGVLSMGVMDHWKGLDRLLAADGSPDGVPDEILCIDEPSRRALRKLYGRRARVHVVGHPHLEGLRRLGRRPLNGRPPEIVVVSQPDTADKGFRSVFDRKAAAALDAVLRESARSGDPSPRVFFRAHPKETPSPRIERRVPADPAADWERSLREHDVFVGLDSMLLVEAGLAGRGCVALRLGGKCGPTDRTVPYRFAEEVGRLSELGPALRRALRRARPARPSCLVRVVRGSGVRVLSRLRSFLTKRPARSG